MRGRRRSSSNRFPGCPSLGRFSDCPTAARVVKSWRPCLPSHHAAQDLRGRCGSRTFAVPPDAFVAAHRPIRVEDERLPAAGTPPRGGGPGRVAAVAVTIESPALTSETAMRGSCEHSIDGCHPRESVRTRSQTETPGAPRRSSGRRADLRVAGRASDARRGGRRLRGVLVHRKRRAPRISTESRSLARSANMPPIPTERHFSQCFIREPRSHVVTSTRIIYDGTRSADGLKPSCPPLRIESTASRASPRFDEPARPAATGSEYALEQRGGVPQTPRDGPERFSGARERQHFVHVGRAG